MPTVEQFVGEEASFIDMYKADDLAKKYLGGIFQYSGHDLVLIAHDSDRVYDHRPSFLFWTRLSKKQTTSWMRSRPTKLLVIPGLPKEIDLAGQEFCHLYIGDGDVVFTGKFYFGGKSSKRERVNQLFNNSVGKSYFIDKWLGVDLYYKTNKYSNLKGKKFPVRLVGMLNNGHFLVHFDPKSSVSSMRFEDYSSRLIGKKEYLRSVKQTGYWEVSKEELVGPVDISNISLD